MRVTRILSLNQAFVECEKCGRETLYQRVTGKDLDYFFCSMDFQRTHTVPAGEILPSHEPEPKVETVQPKPTPKEVIRERVVVNPYTEVKERVIDRVPDPENYLPQRNAPNPDSSKPTVNLRQGTDLHDMQAKMERDAGLWQCRRARRPLTR